MNILFFVLGVAATVVLFAFFYLAAIRPSTERKWMQIPLPDEALVNVYLSDDGDVLADGENGGLYEFYSDPDPVWKKVSEPEAQHPSVTCGPIMEDLYESLPPPGEVHVMVSENCPFAEQANYLEVALLKNGETWFLKSSTNSYVGIGLFVLLPVGVLINVVLYGIWLFFLAIDLILTQRHKRTQTASAP
ncbi:MAG TPA: hypothetical protein PLL38_06875 [Anaerolineales bacterium]|nr:hypothetical protein [Anaerolineales bacterium]